LKTERSLEILWKKNRAKAPQATLLFLKGKEIAQEFGFPLCIRSLFTLVVRQSFIKKRIMMTFLTLGSRGTLIHEVMIDKALLMEGI
jgi:carbamoyl-phosphate synthase large subunit